MDDLQSIHTLIGDLRTKLARLDDNRRAQVVGQLRDLYYDLRSSPTSDIHIDERYRLLAEISPNPVFLQFEGRFFYVNPNGMKLFEAKQPRDILGRYVIDFVAPEYKAVVAERMRIVNEMRVPTTLVEIKVISLSGRTVDVEATAAPTTIDGKPGAVVILHDISQRKATEEALRKSMERERHHAAELTALMDAVPAMIWISRDPECREMLGNRFGYEFLRMWRGANISKTAPLEQVARQRYRNFKDGVEIPPQQMPMQIAAATGQGQQSHEFDVVFDDGSTYHLFGNVVALFDENGRPTGAVGAYIDVTPIKQAEMDLRKSEERLIDFLESTHDGFYALDHEWRIIYANKRVGEMVNIDSSQLVDRIFWQAWPLYIGSQTESHLRRVMEDRTPVHYQAQGTYSDLWLAISAYPTQDGISIFMSDITDIKRAEEELRQAETLRAEQTMQVEIQRRLMENRERERQEIARDLHDGPIQTLVSAIFNTQLAKDVTKESAAQLEFEQIGLAIKSAVRELREVVNELRPPSLIRFGLAKAISLHIEDFQEKHPEIQMRLDLQHDTNRLPERISLSLFRICQEALNNTIRHANASEILVRSTSDRGRIQLEIRDNGQGFVVPEDLSEQTRSGHYGLAGIQERADSIGAVLEIHSSCETGTVVRVTLVVEDAPNLPAPPIL